MQQDRLKFLYVWHAKLKGWSVGERLFRGIPGRIPWKCGTVYGTLWYRNGGSSATSRTFSEFFSVSDFLWHGLAGSIKIWPRIMLFAWWVTCMHCLTPIVDTGTMVLLSYISFIMYRLYGMVPLKTLEFCAEVNRYISPLDVLYMTCMGSKVDSHFLFYMKRLLGTNDQTLR